MASDRSVSDARSERTPPSREERVAAARSVVYGDDETLIAPNDLNAALEEYGVSVGESEDGLPEYRDVPRELSLSACHMAIDLRRDPAEFIAPRA